MLPTAGQTEIVLLLLWNINGTQLSTVVMMKCVWRDVVSRSPWPGTRLPTI